MHNKATIYNSFAIILVMLNCSYLHYQVQELKERLSDQEKVNAAQVEFAQQVVRAITKDEK